ncbi:MAG TPA: hypothetical protein VGK51_11510 [Actinomycetota bacterium]
MSNQDDTTGASPAITLAGLCGLPSGDDEARTCREWSPPSTTCSVAGPPSDGRCSRRRSRLQNGSCVPSRNRHVAAWDDYAPRAEGRGELEVIV